MIGCAFIGEQSVAGSIMHDMQFACAVSPIASQHWHKCVHKQFNIDMAQKYM